MLKNRTINLSESIINLIDTVKCISKSMKVVSESFKILTLITLRLSKCCIILYSFKFDSRCFIIWLVINDTTVIKM